MTRGNTPCGCPCGCTRLSTQPATSSPTLRRRARCVGCSKSEHRAQYPAVGESEEEHAAARPITVDKPLPPALAKLDREIAARQRQEIYDRALAHWLDSLPEKFRKAHTEHPKILERLDRVAAGHPGTAGALVFGQAGEGKTFLALGYANAAIERGLIHPSQVLFGTESELLAAAANMPFSEVQPALRHLTSRQYKMIIIDDVGRGTWLREDMRAKVFMLVLDAAWRDNRIVVITTNLGTDALEDYIGVGAMDRLRSVSGYNAIKLDDRSMRRRVTQASLDEARSSVSPRSGSK